MRLGEVGVADDGDEPMLSVVERKDDEIVVEQFKVLRPSGHAIVTFLRRGKAAVHTLRPPKTAVEEGAEHVRLVTLLLRQHYTVQIFQVEGDERIVHVDAGPEAAVVAGGDRGAARTGRVDQKKPNFHRRNTGK